MPEDEWDNTLLLKLVNVTTTEKLLECLV